MKRSLRRGLMPGLLSLVFVMVSAADVLAQVCGYYYSKPITINGAEISGGPHTNFPVLISHTDPALAAAAGKVKNANGYDIVFTDNAGNLLDFQLEKYTSATGQIVAWVKVPSITNGTNTVIQIRYGNALITTDQSTTGTWSSGYAGVWHFNNNVNDHSSNAIASTNNGSTSTTGKIGDARNFVDPNHWVELTAFPDLTTSFTITGWIYSNDVNQTGARIFVDDGNNTGGYGFSLSDEAPLGRLRFYSRNSTPVSLDASTPLIANNTWYHVAAVADIAGSVKRIYINGVEAASGSYTGAWGTDAGNASIGGEIAGGEAGNRFHGNLDEIRVATRVLSPAWLLTEYRSHNQPIQTFGSATPGDFYSVGAEVTFGDPSQFGTNSWNVYAYNGNNANDALNSYRGFYQHNTVNFNSTAVWGAGSNPGTAAGYSGCSVNDDVHTVRYKRQGFTCGYYQVNIDSHDDGAELFVNGALVWSHNGCCDTHAAVWSGFLGTNTTVEFRWTENAGNSNGAVSFNPVAFPALSPPVTICAGSSTTLTASGAANYDWSLNSTYISGPLTNPTVTVSPPGATPNSTQTYTVRTTDATSGCTVSNSVVVTINPLPSTAVTPTAAAYCNTGSVNVTATGANTYTWSPMTGVTVTSGSGHTATLAPTTTTTYTVTGSNNCASNSATVTVTVNNPTGNPNTFGTDTWNVYAYTGDNFNTYMGYYVDNRLSFDSRDLWGGGTSPSNAPGYLGCAIPNDNHSFRYKREGFPCGYYQIDIPNHDDNVILYVNGANVFQQDSWYANVPHPNVWTGYLGPNSQIEMTIREFGGDSHAGLTFTYLYGPSNNPNQAVWHGGTSTNWATAANWCSSTPTNTISAYIPGNGTTNPPTISAAGAQVLDLTIGTGATLSMTSPGALGVYGNWTNNGTFSAGGGSIINISGSNAITLGGTSATTFATLQMNNSNANSLTLQRDIAISGTLTLTTGRIITGANMVIINNGATATGGSNNSFVSGQVRKIGNQAFTFPIGTSGYYAPIGISAPGTTTDAFTAQYFFSNPNSAGYNVGSLGAGLHHVSIREYWTLARTNGSSNVNVTMHWNEPRSGGVTLLADMRLAGWAPSLWNNLGTVSTSGSVTTGSATTTGAINVNGYAAFTLASSSTQNPLPVELLSFNARLQDDHVLVSWQTSSEKNNDYFTVKKSTNGKDWRVVGTLPGAGTTLLPTSYSLKDTQPLPGLQYYQLTQTDYDGASETFPVIALNIQQLSERGKLTLYPNPTEDDLIVRVTGAIANTFIAQVIDVNGKTLIEKTVERTEPGISVKELPPGVYNMIVSDGQQVYRAKFVRK